MKNREGLLGGVIPGARNGWQSSGEVYNFSLADPFYIGVDFSGTTFMSLPCGCS